MSEIKQRGHDDRQRESMSGLTFCFSHLVGGEEE